MMRPYPADRDPFSVHGHLSRVLGLLADGDDKVFNRTLSWALNATESGARVKRKGWPEGQYLILHQGIPDGSRGRLHLSPSLLRSTAIFPGKKRLILVKDGEASIFCGSSLLDEGEIAADWGYAEDSRSFQWAYDQLKSGKRLRRRSWPDSSFLCMVKGFEIERLKCGRSLSEGLRKKLWVDPSVLVLALVQEGMISELNDYPLSSCDWMLVNA
jgi:hypothetical protein